VLANIQHTIRILVFAHGSDANLPRGIHGNATGNLSRNFHSGIRAIPARHHARGVADGSTLRRACVLEGKIFLPQAAQKATLADLSVCEFTP
jgi:hypothetical protein